MAYDGTGTLYIPAEEWHALLDKHSPIKAKDGCEIRYSEPRMSAGEVVVDYAYSTECAPETWSQRPDWLKVKE